MQGGGVVMPSSVQTGIYTHLDNAMAPTRCLLIVSTKFSVLGQACIWLVLILAIGMSQRAIFKFY